MFLTCMHIYTLRETNLIFHVMGKLCLCINFSLVSKYLKQSKEYGQQNTFVLQDRNKTLDKKHIYYAAERINHLLISFFISSKSIPKLI